HEAERWPFTGAVEDDGGGSAFNLPLPKGTGDDGFAVARDQVILPAVETFRPEAIVLQCGADAVEEDPLSRLSLSNNAHWSVVTALMDMAPRLMVLGGGGYNPWTVGRLWTGVWAMLTGHDIPDVLPEDAQQVLGGLSWSRRRPRPAHLVTTLRDAPRPGEISDDIRHGVSVLRGRLSNWV
ncbi:MAG: acetoin utilization protein AcuC, partial [Pseudomonadota bacterium]